VEERNENKRLWIESTDFEGYPVMKIALVFSSKDGMSESYHRLQTDKSGDESSEPPPDIFAECDSVETIGAVIDSLRERYHVYPIESDEYAFDNLRKAKPDLVFNISERLVGPNRESHIPTLCEILNLSYTGSDPLTLGLCLDKSRTKEILSYHGIPNPEFVVVESALFIPDDIDLPVIIKPLYEGSSKGIRNNSVVWSRNELHKRVHAVITQYAQPAIVERFLTGREFTVGVLGNYPRLEILPIVEIDHSQLPQGAVPIYSYEAKWIWDRPQKPLKIFSCPADITRDLENRIKELVQKTCAVLRIRDWCRIDIRLDELGEPHILEVNPLPGILPNPEDNSCLPKAARAAGYSYSRLVHRVVDEAMIRCGLTQDRLLQREREYNGRLRYVPRHRFQRIQSPPAIQ
jgi:D-alanine-D-alanine ligase